MAMTLEKLAETKVPVQDLIARRWSPRAFSERPVEPEKMLSIFEAARWAASCANEQPWSFLVVTREDAQNHEKALSVLVEANRAWADKAPVLILTFAHSQFDKSGKPNRHAFYDLGQAVANLSIQATSLGLVAHQMAGFSVDGARTQFEVPQEWEPVSAIALGYPGDTDSLPEKLREREIAQRQRKPLETFLFSDKWGNPATITSSA